MKKSNVNLAGGRLSRRGSREKAGRSGPAYPFSAIVGQSEMKLALILNVINPSIGGVLIMGHRGTGKSTAVRGLADLLPEIRVVKDCAYRCDPENKGDDCDSCRKEIAKGKKLTGEEGRITVVDLPLGATEDRVCGSIDIQRALQDGVKAFEPGLLARANRGFLYIDEVNLLEDHLVDLLLDVAATGQNKVERENVSVVHPARFVLIGSGNPEEGELRPQLLDRFGASVAVTTEELEERVEIIDRREAYDRDPYAFAATFATAQANLRKRVTSAQKRLARIKTERALLRKIAELCDELQVDGHRGELTMTRAARALAAFEGKVKVGVAEVKRVAPMALRHRLRRDPLEKTASSEQIQRAIEKVFGDTRTTSVGDDNNDSGRRGADRHSNKNEKSVGPNQQRLIAKAGSAGALGGDTTSKLTDPLHDSERKSSQVSLEQKQSREFLRTQPKPGTGTKSVTNQFRGRYVRALTTRSEGAPLAIDATLRAMLSRQSRLVSGSDLRFKKLSHKSGRLFIFAIDTSGSMALRRIQQAKREILGLLRQSYINRDQVAIVAFRGAVAETHLPPTRSILRARRVLDSLLVGGGTPLSAGLVCALNLAKRFTSKFGEVTVLLFTDGNANVPFTALAEDRFKRQAMIREELSGLRAAFAKLKVRITVVNTQDSYVQPGTAQAIAKQLGADYSPMAETYG